MRRAAHHRTASRTTVSVAPVEYKRSTTATDSLVADRSPSPELFAGGQLDAATGERNQQLAIVIRQRIESRLPGRVRNLEIRIHGDAVLLNGQCSTYYTKQVAQHAAMGVLQNEHLENEIVVAVVQR